MRFPKQPPRFLIPPVQTLIWLGAGYAAHRTAGFPDDCRPLALRIAGWILVILGIALAQWAVRQFRRAGTSEMPWLKPTAFVATGPYLLTRNPMYLGMTLILLGIATIRSSPPMLLAPFGFMITVTLTWIRYEEAVLAKAFGRTYLAYRSRVGRWI